MEGNECYRYRQVAKYVQATGCAAVKTVVDIGANVGDVTQDLLRTFPQARIHAFEVVPALVKQLRIRFFREKRVAIVAMAVHASREPLYVYEALASDKAGWRGGSLVAAADAPINVALYRRLPKPVTACSLDDLVARLGPVDFLKTDCEGSEASFLGNATPETLQQIRWMGGEYHQLARWWPVQQRLAATHRCNLLVEARHAKQLGSFFCERLDQVPGMLCNEPLAPRVYDWGLGEPLWWHGRREAYR